MERHYVKCQNHLAFGTLGIGRLLVFSVLNAKFLAFNTPEANALRA